MYAEKKNKEEKKAKKKKEKNTPVQFRFTSPKTIITGMKKMQKVHSIKLTN
jgi:uncharacterized Zn finger protein (UPF0148 family)